MKTVLVVGGRIIAKTYCVKRWSWKMDYCKNKNIPPAQSWAWDEAEQAYNNK